MHEADIAEAERACTALAYAYARAVDFRDQDALVELFTPDGTLTVGETLAGQDAIRDWIRGRPDEVRSRHVISNVFVDVLGPDHARGIAYLTLYHHEGPESVAFGPVPLTGAAAVGHFEDRFTRTAGGWRFVSRRLQLAFRDAGRF
jgi:uncharacterized protein (TIGR02246 family)